ncbi:LytR C-terminal domain-containing protein [Gemmatimonas sp.]|uniref:LytR C-terminal domain-containing protein n=1 Tax=Gemmatimonas sp. TaxID=1962908 RepID=UPI00333E8F50
MSIGLPTLPPASPPSRTRGRGGVVALALVVIVVAGATAGWWSLRRTPASPGAVVTPRAAALEDTAARAPSGVRIRVRVINVSGITGLARRTTQHLREYGFDVVDFGSGPKERASATRIAVHTGHDAWATRVRKAMGVGEIVISPDSSRYADLTVFVGSDWRAPTETLRP